MTNSSTRNFLIIGITVGAAVTILIIVLLVKLNKGTMASNVTATSFMNEMTSTSQIPKNYSTTVSAHLGMWINVGKMTCQRNQHRATYIPSDDSVLITGGYGSDGSTLAAVDKFLSSCNCIKSFSGNLSTPRSCMASVVVFTAYSNNSQVLFIGGDNENIALAYAELYDPIAGTVLATPFMPVAASNALEAALLSSGNVLFTGGGIGPYFKSTAQVQLFDRTSLNIILLNQSMSIPRQYHCVTHMNALNRTLITGGIDNTILLAQAMTVARNHHSAVYLPSLNKVLLAGGWNSIGDSRVTELFDPITLTFTTAADMSVPRAMFTLTFIPTSGRVLACGGCQTRENNMKKP
ncbi:hypothetical protein I4U23_011276 [Adineta vaga]|nr:hypothetical protein I4U23_011276 [Adineta vaga]